jgi:hypothetical protein
MRRPPTHTRSPCPQHRHTGSSACIRGGTKRWRRCLRLQSRPALGRLLLAAAVAAQDGAVAVVSLGEGRGGGRAGYRFVRERGDRATAGPIAASLHLHSEHGGSARAQQRTEGTRRRQHMSVRAYWRQGNTSRLSVSSHGHAHGLRYRNQQKRPFSNWRVRVKSIQHGTARQRGNTKRWDGESGT